MRHAPKPAPVPIAQEQWVLHCAILAFLCALCYVFFINGPFLSDDLTIIAGNPNIRHLSDVGQFFTSHYWNEVHTGTRGVFRPLREASFSLIYATLGLNPIFYHLASLLLHVAVILLLYFLAKRLFEDDLAAMLGAAMFAVHPIHLEAVLWAKNQAELLVALFVVLSFMAFLSALRRIDKPAHAYGWCAGATALYALGLMCKESALALPGILLLYILFSMPREKMRKALVMVAPMLLVGLAYALFQFTSSKLIAGAVHAAKQPEDALFIRPALVAKTYALYHGLLLFPVQLSAQYDFAFPVSYFSADTLPWLVAFAALAGAVVFGIVLWRRGAYLLLWSFAFLVPAANIIPFKGRPIGDQRLYVASMGACLLFGLAAVHLWRRTEPHLSSRIGAGVGIGLPLLLMIILSLCRGPIWHDENLFWLDMLRKSPAQVEAQYQVGVIDLAAKRDRAALARASYAVETAQKMLPAAGSAIDAYKEQLARSYVLRGRCHGAVGEPALAAQDFLAALQFAPNMASAHFSLGTAYMDQNQFSLALVELRTATELDQGNPLYLTQLANAQRALDQPKAALETVERALAIDPTFQLAIDLRKEIMHTLLPPPY